MRSAAFQRLWLGLSVSYLGDQFTTIALLWFVLQLTGSGAAVGLVILCFELPGILTGALLGRLLDRWQPRLVMGLDNLARAALIAGIPTLCALGWLRLWHVFVLALLAGALSPATAAGVRAFMPQLVSHAALERANALTAMSVQFSYLAGPVAAGFAVARLGAPWALLIDAGSFLLMGLLVLTLPTVSRKRAAPSLATTNRWLGLGALFSVPCVPALTLLSLVFFFSYGPLEAALPVYSSQILHAGAGGYGLLWTGFGAGSFAGVLTLTTLSQRWRARGAADDCGVVGGAAVPAVFHPGPAARHGVSRRRWSILGALYADRDHAAAAYGPGGDPRPGIRRAAFAGRGSGAAGGRCRRCPAAIFAGAAGDCGLRGGLHPRRGRRPHLTCAA
ncbi:MAG TPA: MFS transporter [Bryobacteraceae bacterium]|nr:MFS transporter [Bryobacteraceae bacterium]